ncbi:MAG TPA: hypothetical protein VJ550_09975 [Geomonas sp.]|nr:hypothetical protein [Geomonas sp.]
MNWYCLKITAEEAAAGRAGQVKTAFEAAFAAAQGPRTMALFRKEEDDGETLFFTPVCQEHAAELLSGCGASACPRPSLIGLQLVVGHHEMTYYLP